MSRVSVVIPTLFPTPQLKKYATVLTHYSSVSEVIVIVNTNGSDSDINSVHWRFLGKNKGFTGACNAGARVASGELLLFLNDDCDMSEDALQKMVGFLEQNSDVVATQPIVKKQVPSSKSQVPSTTQINVNEIPNLVRDDTRPESLHRPTEALAEEVTPTNLAIENIGFWIDTRIGKAMPVTNIEDAHKILKQVQDDTDKKEMLRQAQHDRSIYGLSGTCLLIRKDMFEKVGMWNESFHSYLEDVDLAIRLQKAGYKVEPCLNAEVTHEHMATSSKMGLYKEKQDVTNWWRLILKHPDLFVQPAHILPLLIERARNINGLVKKILRV